MVREEGLVALLLVAEYCSDYLIFKIISLENSQKRCPCCQSEKLILNAKIITPEGPIIRISVPKTKKKTSFLNFRTPSVSKIKANVCGDCGNIQLVAEDHIKLWTAYQMSLKNS